MFTWQISKKRTLSGLLAFLLLAITVVTGYAPNKAAAASKETVDLRFIFTTDIHGQLNNIDYESGKEYNIGSLSKAYTLIKQARSEKKAGNSFTFDVGDVLYDYSTEYIFSEDQKALQPIYKGMEKIGYDAMVLGNHDFDYGWDYILDQLSGANLMDKVVVSNLTDLASGDYIFHENMIIERNAVSSSGKKVKVKVGIIGEAIPNLSTKTENYTDRLKMEDIVENTKKQAAKLREAGADVIVALAHTGFGVVDPLPMDGNVAYALTKVPEVDVVLCGHQHNQFPTDNKAFAAYQMPGVDKNTDLINGINLVMSLDRGRSIGIADLTLQSDGNGFKIVDRKSEVRGVKASTASDPTIANNYGDWEEKLYEYSRKGLGNIKAEDEITNYFGLVEDNAGLQLVNDAKRSFAHRYVNTTNQKYKNYPIVASSYYNRYGQNSYKDYVDISGKITESALSSIQIYNNYVALYEITGKQLKEWLEWMASGFETQSNKNGWSDSTMQNYITSNNIPSLLSQEWLDDWSAYRIFDGVEYTIDPGVKPRYDKIGNKISNSSRISKLTCDGKEVTDTMKFVLVTDRITKTVEATQGLDKQYIVKGYNRTQSLLADYVEQLGKVGDIKPTADYNWRLSLNDNYQFIVKASKEADSLAKKQKWYVNTLGTSGDYTYHVGRYGSTIVDTIGPGIVLTPILTEITSQNVPIVVDASDTSGVKTLKYTMSDIDINSEQWDVATEVTDGQITAYSNGIYTVLAVDNLGNKTIGKVMIDNIQRGALQTPVVDTYTNRKSKITGKAMANTTIYFETKSKTYESTVDNLGNFSYALPNQSSGTEFYVYIKDKDGNTSAKRTVKVKRTGPNRPTLSAVNNNDSTITGKTNDSASNIIVLVTDAKATVTKVYLAKDQLASYQASELFKEDNYVYQVPVKITASGKYTVTMPAPHAGDKVIVYGIDHLNRVSRKRNVTVKEAAPDSPQIYDLTDAEREVSGRIPNVTKGVEYKVTVSASGQTFEGKADENGFFTIPVGALTAGESVDAYVTDGSAGADKVSYKVSKVIESMDDYVTKNSGITLNNMTNKEYKVSGNADAFQSIYVSVGNKVQLVETDADGDFTVELDKRLAAGSKVYAYQRFSNGGIVAAQGMTVKAAVPDKPAILQDRITNHTKDIQVVSEEKCTVTVTVGKESYTNQKPTYNKEDGLYVYNFTIARTNSGASVKIAAKNKVGSSKTLSLTIAKEAPNVPATKAIDTEAEEITGKVELLLSDKTAGEATVESTKTKVIAKIGSKEYKASIKDDGTFTIKIPKQKKGAKITIWGENYAGKGPQGTIKVSAAKK